MPDELMMCHAWQQKIGRYLDDALMFFMPASKLRGRTCFEHLPIKFFARCPHGANRHRLLAFKLDLAAASGPEEPPQRQGRRGVALHLFHPMLPLVLTVFQVRGGREQWSTVLHVAHRVDQAVFADACLTVMRGCFWRSRQGWLWGGLLVEMGPRTISPSPCMPTQMAGQPSCIKVHLWQHGD